jgi:hypothetical protein
VEPALKEVAAPFEAIPADAEMEIAPPADDEPTPLWKDKGPPVGPEPALNTMDPPTLLAADVEPAETTTSPPS